MTVTVLTTPFAQYQVKSGTNYTANNQGVIACANGDVLDLLNAGCSLTSAAENAPVLPWVAGRVYGIPLGSTQASVLTVTGTIYAYPIFVPNAVSVKTISINSLTGQTGGAAHAGIYEDALGVPSNLVTGSDSGALAATATAIGTGTYATAVALTPGWYWLASIFTASSTFPSVGGVTAIYANSLNAMLGSDTIAHAMAVSGQAATGISVAGTYGVLPALFPSGSALTLNATTPAVALGL